MPNDQAILDARPPKAAVDFNEPYLYLHEQEAGADGRIRAVNTIFLTNKECPFKCVMCDLWKHTKDAPTPPGAIPRQIAYALKRLPPASAIKLYNSGNFFDRKAIPPSDYGPIADLLTDYDHVIVENHPKLCGKPCIEFAELLDGSLEIAMGIETIHPDVLPRLNKQITKENVSQAASFLAAHDIAMRAFLLLNPPYLPEPEAGIQWAVQSAAFAFDQGISACAIIPTRAGNGFMEQLHARGEYRPPTLGALEAAIDQAMQLNGGRVFADLWDLQQFASCTHCFEQRKTRLHRMNLQQQILPRITCTHCNA